MKKFLLTFLTLFFVSPTVWAENCIYFNITQEMSVLQIQTELQEIIDNAALEDTIVVTGSKTNADVALVLHIIEGKMVVWQAHYQSNYPFGANNLISFSGDGTFAVKNGTLITENANAIEATGTGSTVMVCGNGEVHTSGDGMNAITTYGYAEIKDNAKLSSTTGETIESNSDNATVLVSGGTISATSENAIITWGKNAQIFISGGYVYNDAVGYSMVINVADYRPDSEALVHVSGTARVEAKGDGEGVFSCGYAIVSGNAQVSNNRGSDYSYIGAVRAIRNVEIKDFANIRASNNFAVCSFEKVTVSGNSIVEAKGNAIAICVSEKHTAVEVRDKARVIATNNYAIYDSESWSLSLSISGGLAFAFGKKVLDVIHYEDFAYPTDSGVVLAWNKNAGNTNYEMFSAEDLFVSPGSATAYWDMKDGISGIYYANGENIGFVPIDLVNVLSVKENGLLNVKIYPNPTRGQLTISFAELAPTGAAVDNGQWTINSVEIFDVYGRKQFSIFNSQLSIEKMDISDLSNGIYFVKINTEHGEVVKKVVKR